MIDKITKNNKEIEYYYNIGSIHGEIRILLHKYVYDEVRMREAIELYNHIFKANVNNININLDQNLITFDINKSSLDFQNEFAHCLYMVISKEIINIGDCIDLFERDNPRYKELKDSIDVLLKEDYYITLFRTSFIKHERGTSCILKL